jgi:DNA-binding transcriptional regulator YhcF (GntR family)
MERQNTDKSHLYQQIFALIRNEILSGKIKPGALLPPMREMAKQWNCATGTIMHVYQDLAKQGFVVSRVKQGTRVVEKVPQQNKTSLQKAYLFNRAEAFLLETMIAGYSPDELEQSLLMAINRWRAFSIEQTEKRTNVS